MGLAINVELFKKHIKVTDNYHLFCAFDDICIQFLNQGIYNVVITFLQIWHDQYIKEGKVPIKSAQAAQLGDSKHFGDYGPHFVYWKNTCGWERDNVKNTFYGQSYLHPTGPRMLYDLANEKNNTYIKSITDINHLNIIQNDKKQDKYVVYNNIRILASYPNHLVER